MFDSISGVALGDPTRGWTVSRLSTLVVDESWDSGEVSLPGRDGHVAAPGSVTAPAATVAVICPAADVEAVRALMRSANPVLGVAGGVREVAAKLRSVRSRKSRSDSTHVEVVGLFELPDVYARAVSTTTSTATALDDGDVTVSVFPGISAPIRDAIVRVKGSVTGLQIDGGNGSWFSYAPNVGATSYFRFESATGRAFVTATDTWAGGTEVTGSVLNGPGPYFFELTPTFTDPTVRTAELRVTTTVRSGTPTVEVRGRNAFLL